MRMNKINLFDMETKCTSSSFIIPAQRDITSSAGDLTVQNVILNSYVCILANFRSTSAYQKIFHFDWLDFYRDVGYQKFRKGCMFSETDCRLLERAVSSCDIIITTKNYGYRKKTIIDLSPKNLSRRIEIIRKLLKT